STAISSEISSSNRARRSKRRASVASSRSGFLVRNPKIAILADLFERRRGRLLQEIADHIGHGAGEVRSCERKRHIGLDKTFRRAAVEGAAAVVVAVEALLLLKLQHAVGELDLVAGAPFLVLQDREDLRLQDVAAVDEQVR